MRPKVTAIMPVYNRPNLVRNSIDSIINQSFKNWQLIIIDDDSNKETKKLLDSYKDDRIIIIRLEKNIGCNGIGRVRNIGIEKAMGEYIAICDSDDIRHPESFAIQSTLLDRFKNVGLVGSIYEEIDLDGNIILEVSPLKKWRCMLSGCTSEYIRHLYKNNRFWYSCPILPSSSMIRMIFLQKVGGFPEHWKYHVDSYVHKKLADLCDIAIVDKVLVYYRVHDNRLTTRKWSEGWVEPLLSDNVRKEPKVCKYNKAKNLFGEPKLKVLFFSAFGFFATIVEQAIRPSRLLASGIYKDIIVDYLTLPRNYLQYNSVLSLGDLFGSFNIIIFVKPTLFYDFNSHAGKLFKICKKNEQILISFPVDVRNLSADYLTLRYSDYCFAISKYQYNEIILRRDKNSVYYIGPHHREMSLQKIIIREKVKTIVWENPGFMVRKQWRVSSQERLKEFAKVLQKWCKKRGINLIIYNSFLKSNIEWGAQMAQADIAIECKALDFEYEPYLLQKPATKLLNYMALGIPTICDGVPSYVDVGKHLKTCVFANTIEEYKYWIDKLSSSHNLRSEISKNAYTTARKYSLNQIIQRYYAGIMKVAVRRKLM